MITRLLGDKPPEEMLKASRERLDAMFRQQFAAAEESRQQRQRITQGFMQPFIEQAKQNKEHPLNVRRLGERSDELSQQRLYVPENAPVKQRIFLNSIGVTKTPSYDWPWTWSTTSGSPDTPQVNADNGRGTMHIGLHAGSNGGAAAGAAAVGFLFRPTIQDIGILQITSNPALSYQWWTYNAFDSSHSDGWVGIYVGAYTLEGTQYTHIDQRSTLWDESHSFLSSPDGRGSNAGYPLSAAMFVNSQSFYEVWVWCGGSVSADGDHTFWGSWAGAFLDVSVPFIHLELWG
jgi:hypothetical protein